MHKRKLTGILKYGKRIYPTKKFQAGGHIAVTTGEYDWRDDPYEKQLSAERLARQKQAAKTSNANSSGSFNSSFESLTGGLKGSREQYKKEFSQMQQGYLGAVQERGVEWAKSPSGIAMYQQVLDFGAEKQQMLTAEGKLFDDLKKDAKKDMGALAISGNDMFVAVVKPTGEVKDDGTPEMRTTFQEISIDEYTRNKSLAKDDPEKLEIIPRTLADFSTWKQQTYNPNSAHLIKKYLGKGAQSMETFYKENAEPLLKSAEVTIDKESKMLSGKGDMTISLVDIQETIDNIINGGDGSGASYVNTVTASSDKGVMRVVDHIFNQAISEGNSYDVKRLRNTLQAEVLSDPGVERQLQAIRTKGGTKEEIQGEIDTFMASRMKIALVNRLIFARKTKTKTEIGENGHKVKGDMDGQTSAVTSWVMNGDRDNTMVFSRENKDKKRKDKYVAVGMSNATKISELNIAENPLLSSNPIMEKDYDLKHIYLPDGTEITGEQGLFGEHHRESGIEKMLILEPETGVDVVYVPEIDGKPNAFYFNQPRFTDLKDEMKQQYIDYLKDIGEGEGLKVADLTEGNHIDKVAYGKYRDFINMYDKLEYYKQKFASSTGDAKVKAKKDLDMATKSAQMIVEGQSKLQIAFRGEKVELRPYGYVSVLANDDGGMDIEDKIQPHFEGVSLDVSSADHTHMEKVQDSHNQGDYGNIYNPGHWLSDDNVKFRILVKVVSPAGRNGAGNNAREAMLMSKLEKEVKKFVNSGSLTSTLTPETTAGFYI